MLFAPGLPRLFATHPPIEERLKALDPGFDAKQLAVPRRKLRATRNGSVPMTQGARRPAGAAEREPAGERSLRGSAHGIVALAGTFD